MNFHTAEAGFELTVAIAHMVGLNGERDATEDKFMVVNAEWYRWAEVIRDEWGCADESFWWNPTGDVAVAIELAERINFFLGAMLWRDPGGDYICDFSRKLGARPTLTLTWVRAPTIALCLCRAIGVVHQYNRVHPAVSAYTPKAMPVLEETANAAPPTSSIIAIADAQGKVTSEVNK